MESKPAPLDPEPLLAHAAWIRRLALGLVGREADADDVAQDAWLAAVAHPPSRGDGLRPWLARVARNFASKRRRGDARRAERETAAAAPEALPSAAALVERMELQRRMVELVLGLREPYRSILYLRFYEELACAEIARRTGAPEGTVRSQLARGLEELRERLDAERGGRAAWSAVLFPLAAPALIAPAAATAASTATAPTALGTLGGTLAMKLSTKLVAVALMAAAAGGGWWIAARGADAPTERAAAPAPDTAPVASTDNAAPPPAAAASSQPQERSAVASEAPAPRAAKPAPAEPASEFVFEARVLDTSRTPLANAMLTIGWGGGSTPRSGSDGRLRFVLKAANETGGFPSRIECPGYATRFLEAVGRRGTTTHLGDVVLPRGGRAAGRVVDAKGAPVADAKVIVPLSTSSQDFDSERLLGPETYPGAPEAKSRADGTFVVDAIVPGTRRVWAGAEGMLHGCTKLVEIRGDDETQSLEIVLEPMPPKSRIEGVVLQPDGSFIPNASVRTHWSDAQGSEQSGVRADSKGRFVVLLKRALPYDLTAEDADGRWNDVHASAVAPGTHDVVLQFRETRKLEIVAKPRGGGAALDAFEARTMPAGDGEALETKKRAPADAAPPRLREPDQPFRVEVDASGFALATLGPFTPGETPLVLEAALEPMQGLRGRVTARGEPVAGAKVEAFAIAASDESIQKNFFATRVRPYVLAASTTDTQGRFLLTPRAPADFVVRATLDGYAPAEVERLAVDPALGTEPIELALGQGGAIEGRVRAPDGVDTAGTIVVVSRYDGNPRTMRVPPGGRYRFDRLTPGRWNVEIVDQEISPAHQTISHSTGTGRRQEYPTLCDVLEGETTTFDLDLRRSQPCLLNGELRLDGKPAEGFRVMVTPHGNVWSRAQGPTSSFVDAAGKFALTIPAAGRVRLAILPPSKDVVQAEMSADLDVIPGNNSWRADVQTGQVDVENAPAGTDVSSLLLFHAKSGGVEAWIPITGGEKRRCTLTLVPAGRGAIVRPRADAPMSTWPTVMEVDVPAGGTANVKL